MKLRLPPEVAKLGLCTRCGYCFGACPHGIIHPDHNLYPAATKKDMARCTECGLCILGCSADVDFRSLYQALYGIDPQPFDVCGVILKAFVGHSTNATIRTRASSGGIVTGLLVHLLKSQRIEQALICAMSKKHPCKPEPIMAQTTDEITASAQSKYTIVPQMKLAASIKRSRKATAVVGLPCHIHSLRKLEMIQQGLIEKVPVIIGLACHSTLEAEATDMLLRLSQLHPTDIHKLEYRGGDIWPGGIQATLHNGSIKKLHDLNIKSAFNRLNLFYTPQRCRTCIDHTSEFSDISVMDPWIRNEKGELAYPHGDSLILVRTERGLNIVGQATADGDIDLQEIPLSILPNHFLSMAKKKKIGASIRIENLKRKGRPYPDYNLDFPPPKLMSKVRERMYSLVRMPCRFRWVRNIGMRFCFSAFGNMLMTTKARIRKNRCEFLKFKHKAM